MNRPLGRVFAALAYSRGLGPNAVTLLSALCTFAAIAVIAWAPSIPAVGIPIWLLLAVGYALDSSDGQVARLNGGGSLAGEWLDHVIDAAKIASLHVAVWVHLSRHAADLEGWVLLVPLVYGIVASTTFFAMILNDQLRRSARVPEATGRGGSSPWRSLLLLPTDYGVLCAVFGLIGMTRPFVVVYLAFCVANVAFAALALPRWFGAMRAIDTTQSEVPNEH